MKISSLIGLIKNAHKDGWHVFQNVLYTCNRTPVNGVQVPHVAFKPQCDRGIQASRTVHPLRLAPRCRRRDPTNTNGTPAPHRRRGDPSNGTPAPHRRRSDSSCSNGTPATR